MDRISCRGIDRLLAGAPLADRDLEQILSVRGPAAQALLASEADKARRRIYGTDVYLRGLIEFTNICRNNCLYCGLRRDNANLCRYRLTEEAVLSCCEEGFRLGFRTFVLQGGEDPGWPPERIEGLVRLLRARFPGCAITLSVGEMPREVYQAWRRAGADRYLLRHETADPAHYAALHPREMSFQNRIRCLWDLKELGYAVGCGMMVGSPGQRTRHLVRDLALIRDLRPDMVGIGPFLPQHDTPLGDQPAGTLNLTLYLLSVIRLMLPDVLLPATTALATLHPQGREMGFRAGANVCMPNLSPPGVRKNYALYDGKLSSGPESAGALDLLCRRLEAAGYRAAMVRGDRIRTRKEDRT